MDLLIIGGTRFLGRRIVESALSRGHKVTLFFRGKDGADLFEGKVEKILGDRDGGLDALAGRRWDACVDTPGFFPRVVRASCEALRDAVDRYLFVSTISVYDPPEGTTAIDENTRRSVLEGDVAEEFSGATYGPLKALCEDAVNEIYGDRAMIVRPGYIVGAYDTSDRFTYYPWRLVQGGRMLCGGRKDAPLQIVDARDIADFCVLLLEKKASGVMNVCGPQQPYGWAQMIEGARAALGVSTELAWADAAKFEVIGGKAGADLPLYPGADSSTDSFMRVDNSRSLAAGLKFRPLADTVRDTAEWVKTRGAEPLKVGMSLEREAELLGLLDF